MADDMTGKIMEILSNPEMMKKISDVMGSLGGGGAQNAQTPSPSQSTDSNGGGTGDLSSSMNALFGADSAKETSELAANAKKMINTLNHTDDRRINLLNAIKPYMRESRASGVDKAVRLLRLTKLTEIFRNEIK